MAKGIASMVAGGAAGGFDDDSMPMSDERAKALSGESETATKGLVASLRGEAAPAAKPRVSDRKAAALASQAEATARQSVENLGGTFRPTTPIRQAPMSAPMPTRGIAHSAMAAPFLPPPPPAFQGPAGRRPSYAMQDLELRQRMAGTDMEPYAENRMQMLREFGRPGELADPLMATSHYPGSYEYYRDHQMYPGQLAHTGYDTNYPHGPSPFVVTQEPKSAIMSLTRRR